MDRKNLFPIGEVSKLFHISVSSLRHYEHIGLLTPEYISSDSGYRYYGTEQFEVLNTIRYLRALDMPLSDHPVCGCGRDGVYRRAAQPAGLLLLPLRRRHESICHHPEPERRGLAAGFHRVRLGADRAGF